MESLEQDVGLGSGLSLHGAGHERRRCLRDGASGALKADVADPITFEADPDGHLIATHRVVALRRPAGIGHGPVIPGRPVVLQDDVLVQLTEAGHQPNTVLTRSTPRTRASTSSRVL